MQQLRMGFSCILSAEDFGQSVRPCWCSIFKRNCTKFQHSCGYYNLVNSCCQYFGRDFATHIWPRGELAYLNGYWYCSSCMRPLNMCLYSHTVLKQSPSHCSLFDVTDSVTAHRVCFLVETFDVIDDWHNYSSERFPEPFLDSPPGHNST